MNCKFKIANINFTTHTKKTFKNIAHVFNSKFKISIKNKEQIIYSQVPNDKHQWRQYQILVGLD